MKAVPTIKKMVLCSIDIKSAITEREKLIHSD